MQYEMDLIAGTQAQKPLEIEPYNERKAAYAAQATFDYFQKLRETNRTVHAIRRRSTGMALAYGH